MNEYMEQALACAHENLLMTDGKRDGGPFGAVIVHNGKIISRAHNSVGKCKDPTMHAEIAAIREATKILNKTYLDDCEIYCSCFPCPMCLGAIYWAKIPKVFYGSTTSDSSINIDTDDSLAYAVVKNVLEKQHCSNIDEEIGQIEFVNIDRAKCTRLLCDWDARERKTKSK